MIRNYAYLSLSLADGAFTNKMVFYGFDVIVKGRLLLKYFLKSSNEKFKFSSGIVNRKCPEL